jgi:quercetin dioxygenase-like cupin family protein
VTLTVVDTTTAPWEKFPVPRIHAELDALPLIADPDTGMQVMKLIYRAGLTNPWHTHPCALGIYVLDGTLATHQGEYPPGSFVWFPEGGTMNHGAAADEDCTFLFIRNKPFDIHHGRPLPRPAAGTGRLGGARQAGSTRWARSTRRQARRAHNAACR